MFKRKKQNDARFRLIEAEVVAASAMSEEDDETNAVRIAGKYNVTQEAVLRGILFKRKVQRVRQMYEDMKRPYEMEKQIPYPF